MDSCDIAVTLSSAWIFDHFFLLFLVLNQAFMLALPHANESAIFLTSGPSDQLAFHNCSSFDLVSIRPFCYHMEAQSDLWTGCKPPGRLTLPCLVVDSLTDIPHMGSGLKHVLEREENQWPNGKVVMASHSLPPLRSANLSQRTSSNSHLFAIQPNLFSSNTHTFLSQRQVWSRWWLRCWAKQINTIKKIWLLFIERLLVTSNSKQNGSPTLYSRNAPSVTQS